MHLRISLTEQIKIKYLVNICQVIGIVVLILLRYGELSSRVCTFTMNKV